MRTDAPLPERTRAIHRQESPDKSEHGLDLPLRSIDPRKSYARTTNRRHGQHQNRVDWASDLGIGVLCGLSQSRVPMVTSSRTAMESDRCEDPRLALRALVDLRLHPFDLLAGGTGDVSSVNVPVQPVCS